MARHDRHINDLNTMHNCRSSQLVVILFKRSVDLNINVAVSLYNSEKFTTLNHCINWDNVNDSFPLISHLSHEVYEISSLRVRNYFRNKCCNKKNLKICNNLLKMIIVHSYHYSGITLLRS